jgi:hypothetical protein
MSLPIERWAKEAIAAEFRGDWEPVADKRVLQDVSDLATLHMLTWRERQRELVRSGWPLAMPEGTYAGLLAYPNPATITTTSISGVVNLYPNLIYAPIQPNSLLAPQAYRVAIIAKVTTSTSPANLTLSPFLNTTGTWTTGGTAASGGIALGATGAVAYTASITNAFYVVIGDVTMRTVGLPGTNSTAVAMLHYTSTQATVSGLAGPAVVGAGHNLMFGGTNASFDSTVLNSFQLAATHTVTTITHNLEQIHFMDWN